LNSTHASLRQKGAAPRRPRARHGRRGNALIEFLLAVPILGFMMAFAVYMSFAMLTRQQVIIEARANLWHSVNNDAWSPMDLLTLVNPLSPPPAPQGWGNKPRGTGEELDRLVADIQGSVSNGMTNSKAIDYWFRLRDNLPGRSDIKVSRSFTTKGAVWDFIDHKAAGDHTRDSSAWHFPHLDAWEIARSGPLSEVFQAFEQHLDSTAAPHFEQTREDILTRW
jgi:hypothetical protein